MDPMTVIILLLVAFLAWQQGIDWLFIVTFALMVVLARSITITLVAVLAVIAMYMGYAQYWWIFLMVIGGIALYASAKKGGGGGEYYSPELMRLLGGG